MTTTRTEHPGTGEIDSLTLQVAGVTYGVLALRDDDGFYHPDVTVLHPVTGEPVTTIIDGERTDEAYTTDRTCLLHAVGHIL